MSRGNSFIGTSTYDIVVNGCDDDTVFQVRLTEEEYRIVLFISALCNKTSRSRCQPRIFVTKEGNTTLGKEEEAWS